MSKSKKRKKGLYRLGFRLAVYTAFISAVFIFLLVWLLIDISTKEAIAIASSSALIIFLAGYAVAYYLQYRRLKLLENLIKNIAKKKFREYKGVSSSYNDELDLLFKQGIKSSRTIEREIQRLNRIENYRKEFIGDISHELKTPIFAIQGFVETLLNGALEDEEVNRDFLRKAMRNVNRLIYLTKDLMEISKLETGELKSEIEEISLKEVLHDILESLNYKAQKENIQLIFPEVNKNLWVNADKNQLKQALINLIENGIKYNIPGGKVEVEVRSVPNDKDRIFLSVRDTGIGIDSKDISRVTERFFRVDKSRSREKGGTGLGLAIVKHIMEAHGEQFIIESKPNKGSKFTISLKKAD